MDRLRCVRVAALAFAVVAWGCGGDDGGLAPSPLPDGDAADEDASRHDAALEVNAFKPEASAERDAAVETGHAPEEPSPDAPDAPDEADAFEEGRDGAADAGLEGGPQGSVDAGDAGSEAADASGDLWNGAADGGDLVLSFIMITPPSSFLFPRMSVSLAATGVYYDPSTGGSPVRDITRLVTWSSSRPADLLVSNTPGFQGRLTAINTSSSITVTATLGNVSGTTDIAVGSPSLVEIGIAPTRWAIPKGVPFRLYAMGVWSTGDKLDFTDNVAWSTSDSNIFSFDGNLVTPKAVGTASITAKVANLTDTLTVSVAAPVLQVIAVTPSTPTIAASTSLQLVATGTFADASTEDLTEFVTWTSSNEAAAKFADANRKGVVAGLGEGSATLTATFGGISSMTTLGVTTATLASLEVTSDRHSYPMWVDHQVHAIGHFSNGSTQDVSAFASWASSDQDVMAGRKLGSTMVTATYLGVSGSTTIAVVEAILDALALAPSSPTVVLGHDQPFHADATYLDADAQPFHLDLTAQAGWLSSDKSVARIDNVPRTSGFASSLRSGTTTISGAFTGVGNTTTLTVASQSSRSRR